MKTEEILNRLQAEFHTAVFASIGDDGHPQVRAIDIMLAGKTSLFFLTARGKEFYRQCMNQRYIALASVKQGVSITLSGKIRPVGGELLELIFEKNPYMKQIYPEDARSVLVVFELYEGQGELFDLNQRPIYRQTLTLGNLEKRTGYQITARCTGCGLCSGRCPQRCIQENEGRFIIEASHCLHCGLCEEICPAKAVEFMSL